MIKARPQINTAIKAIPILTAAILAFSLPAAERKISEEQWEKLRQGEIVREVKKEGGTQSGAWSVGFFKRPPELMWRMSRNE